MYYLFTTTMQILLHRPIFKKPEQCLYCIPQGRNIQHSNTLFYKLFTVSGHKNRLCLTSVMNFQKIIWISGKPPRADKSAPTDVRYILLNSITQVKHLRSEG